MRFEAEPAYRFRRWSRFPFFFQSHNPSFQIRVTKFDSPPERDPWPDNKIQIDIVFPDGSTKSETYVVPEMKFGESRSILLEDVFTAQTGQVQIVIPGPKLHFFGGGAEYYALYSYEVRSEESIWLAVGSVVLLLAGAGLGQILQSRPDVTNQVPEAPPPIVQPVIVLPPIATQPAPSPTASVPAVVPSGMQSPAPITP